MLLSINKENLVNMVKETIAEMVNKKFAIESVNKWCTILTMFEAMGYKVDLKLAEDIKFKLINAETEEVVIEF